MAATIPHEFKKDQQYEGEEDSVKQIQLLEVYVEKTKSITLGQRLVWHLNMIDKHLTLPILPQAQDFYLRALNASFKNERHMIGAHSQEVVYCHDSNTVFYYNEYKVLLLMDFSKSTSSVYPYQDQCYVEKLQDAIEIFIHNLWFKLKNKYSSESTEKATSNFKKSLRKGSHQPGLMEHISARVDDCPTIIHEVAEDDFSPSMQPHNPKKLHQSNTPAEYIPAIYLSIVASGLPRDNHMRLLVHNQRLDDQTRNEVLKSLQKRLEMVVTQLAENSKSTYDSPEKDSTGQSDKEEPQEEYLQQHLANASRILSLMRPGAKSLLVMFTDSTCSLMGRSFQKNGKSLDSVISRLHSADTKIITVDLGDENRVANTFGFINHDEHLKYLAYVTSGAHFDYATLIKLAGEFSQNYMGYQQLQKAKSGSSFYRKDRPQQQRSSFGLGLIQANSYQLGSQQKLGALFGSSHKQNKIFNSKKQQQDLSENDKFHMQLNSLQKLMFARPCNYSGFLQHQEIQQLVNYQERLIFENRVSSNLIRQLRKDKNLAVNPSFSVQELLLNGHYTPIFRKEQLSEYHLRITHASQVCEYRSRMCFQFRKLRIAQGALGNPVDVPSSKIYYQYWWSNQILILCSIEQGASEVHVVYKLVAQEEVIDQLKRDRKLILSKNAKKDQLVNQFGNSNELSLLEQLTQFLKEIQKCDQKFELFQKVSNDIESTYKVIKGKQNSGKYQQKREEYGNYFTSSERQSSTTSQARFQDEDQFEQASNKDSSFQNSRKQSKMSDVAPESDHNVKPQVVQNQKISEEEARTLLTKHKLVWQKLSKIPVSQWKQLFIYSRLDMVTHSNFEQTMTSAANGSTSSNIYSQLESIQCQDRNISKKTFSMLQNLTTFSLDPSTFIQVFKEKKSSKDSKHFGFVLIKIEWAAANIAICHFGFYMVSPKSINSFVSQFRKVFQEGNNTERPENGSVCYNVYDKYIASLLVSNTKSYAQSNFIPQEHSSSDYQVPHTQEFERILFKENKQLLKPFKRGFDKHYDICYNKQWTWQNENALTNKDYFEAAVRQRINEGFIFVNSDQSSEQNTYLFIKIVQAHKQRKGCKVNQASFKINRSVIGFAGLSSAEGKQPFQDCVSQSSATHQDGEDQDTHILVQYVMRFDSQKSVKRYSTKSNSNNNNSNGHNEDHHQHTSFRTELLVEQETAYFYLEKNHNNEFGSFSGVKKDLDINILSDKNFFHELAEYVFSVDHFLFNNICTYHNVIKNSVFKVVESNLNEAQLIKSDLCYFKNLFSTEDYGTAMRTLKARKRLRLEYTIKSKMQLLRRDWREYIKTHYPELFSLGEEENQIFSCEGKVVEEKGFVLQIEELLENSKLISKEELRVPEFIFNQRADNLKDILSQFYDSILKIYDEFSDFKILKFQNGFINSDKYLFFAKLVTKQILFLIKMPSKQEFLDQILSHKGNEGTLQVEYYRLTKKMIRLSKKLSRSRIMHFLNPDFNRHQRERMYTDQSSNIDEEEEEENINQIDQICDFIFYYESSMREGTQQLQFEPNIQTIISNFLGYLRSNYDIIFSDTVLMNIGNEPTSRRSSEDEQKRRPSLDCQEHLQNDFKKIKQTITRCRFRMDISFLCLLMNQLEGRKVDSKFEDSIDEVFTGIISRNFRQFEADPDLLVFQTNQEYDGNRLPFSYDDNSTLSPPASQKHSKLSEQYLVSLEATKDSYSDNEDIVEQTRRQRGKQFPPVKKSVQEAQASCKKLLFKVDLIIKNAKGEIVVEKKLSKFSEIFHHKDVIKKVCKELATKAKYIVEERQQAAKINLGYLNHQMIEDTYQFLDEQFKSREESEDNQIDAESAVEIYFSFYTTPQFVGLIKDQDVDYLCLEQDEILVNDDDHEDLIRVTKINNLLHEADQSKRFELEDLSELGKSWPLFRPFNKKQLVKSIPYYFKSGHRQSKDYRVFQFDEIQRKIIYGILRRTYALIASGFLEYLSLVTKDIDPLNIIIQQKYMGALLYKQRKIYKTDPIIELHGSKIKQAEKILSNDLKTSGIINVGSVQLSDKGDEVFFVRSSARLKNFYLSHELENGEQIPFNSFLGQESDQHQSRNLYDLDKYEKEQAILANEEFEIPFWTLFRIIHTMKDKNMVGLQIEIIQHLPMYKTHTFLDEMQAEKEFKRCIDLISKRVKIMLSLQYVDESREIPANLSLNEYERAIEESPRKTVNLSLATSLLTQNRMELAMKKMQTKDQGGHLNFSNSPTLNKQNSQGNLGLAGLQQTSSGPTLSSQKTTIATTSRIKKRMDKFTKNSSKIEEPTSLSLSQVEEVHTHSDPKLLQKTQDVLKVNKVFQHEFLLNNSMIRVEDAIKAIQDKAFFNFRISSRSNLYVTRSDNNAYLIKITGQQAQSDLTANKLSSLRSFGQNQSLHSNHLNQAEQPDEMVSVKEIPGFNVHFHGNFMNNPTYGAKNINSGISQNIPTATQSSIQMEVFGANIPLKSDIEFWIQSIESNLTKITIEKLADTLLKHPGHITKDELSYIEASDQKMLVAFPIDTNIITDSYALMKYLKQNLSRFLIPVHLSQPAQNKKHINIKVTDDISRSGFTESIIKSNGQSPNPNAKQSIGKEPQSFFSSRREINQSFNDSQQLCSSALEKSVCDQSAADPYDDYCTIERLNSDSPAKNHENGTHQPELENLRIPYKQDDFNLIYNYQMQIGPQKTEKNAQKFTIQNIFGQSLTLSNISILNKFNYGCFDQSGFEGDASKDSVINDLIQNLEGSFQLDGSSIIQEQQLKAGLRTSGSKRDVKITSYMPLVFQSFKKGSRTDQSDQLGFRNINGVYQIPKPQNIDQDQTWLMLKLNILGTLQADLFIKNLILNLNQAIYECQIEFFMKNQFQSVKQDCRALSPNNRQKQEKNDGSKILKDSNLTNPSKQIDMLKLLLTSGLEQHSSSLISSFEKLIYGDNSVTICNIINSLIGIFHSQFKTLSKTQTTGSSNDCEINEWNITLIIELVNYSTSKLEKTIIFSFGEEIQPIVFEQFQKELSVHLNKTKTQLRNIHPQVKIVLGSFKIEGPHDPTIIYKEFKNQVFKFDGLKPETPHYGERYSESRQLHSSQSPDKNIQCNDRLSRFKIYPNIQTTVNTSGTGIQAQILQPRNFFFIMGIKDNKLEFKSYNLEETMQKQCEDIIASHIIWQSNRQNFFKRIVSEKLGTVYTLKDYYSSDHLIKDQTISILYNASSYTYEKPASIIEGKQVYNFSLAIKKQQRKSKVVSKRNASEITRKKKASNVRTNKVLPLKDVEQMSVQLQGDLYLKEINLNEGNLLDLYEKISYKGEIVQKQPQTGVIDNQNKPQTHEKQENLNNEQTKKSKLSKLVISFEDLVQHKVVSRAVVMRDKTQDLKLTHMYVISPSLLPSRANTILAERERFKHQHQMMNPSGKKQSFNDMLYQIQGLNNKTLISNPLFFHGMKMITMLQHFFHRIKQSQQIAVIYKQCEDLSIKKPQMPLAEDQRQFANLIELTTSKKTTKSKDQQVHIIHKIIEKSRLLYSNTTQQLFDVGITNDRKPHNDGENAFFDEILPDLKAFTSFIGGDPQQHNNKLKQQKEDLRKDFLNEYNNFLTSKAGVVRAISHKFIVTSMPTEQHVLVRNKSKISKLGLTKRRSAMGYHGEDDIFSKTNKFGRPKKNSEDIFGSMESLKRDKTKEMGGGSNSSILLSSHDTGQVVKGKRMERVLHEISEENQDSSQLLYSYIVKPIGEDNLIIYKLTYNQGLICINVYKFESFLKSFPRQIVSDYYMTHNLPGSLNIIKERKRQITIEEQQLSMRLNTDSFNYDFHLKEISNQIVVQSHKQEFNVSQQIFNLLSFYKTPPKFSKNQIDVVMLKFDLGYLNKISESDFLAYFCSKYKQYGFKIFAQPEHLSYNHQALQYSKSAIGTLPQQNIENPNDRVKYAFYKEEGVKPKISNFETSQQQHNQDTASRRATIIISNTQKPFYPQALLDQVQEVDEDQSIQLSSNRNVSHPRSSSLHPIESGILPIKKLSDGSSRKLYFVELRNQQIHSDQNEHCDVYKKVWNIQCRRHESTYSQICVDEDDNEHKTILELVFYMIYTVPLSSNQLEGKPFQLNSDRYPLPDVCTDMSKFIVELESSFSECRKDLVKDQLWSRFFDQACDMPLTDTQIHDMLKFSQSYDLKTIDNRYKDLLSLNLYKKPLSDYLKVIFGKHRCYAFNNNVQIGAMMNMEREHILPDLLIYDPDCRHFMIHVEFSISQRKVQFYLVRKDNIESEYSKIIDEEGTIRSRERTLQELLPVEEILIKQLINHLSFWLWKRAV